MTSKKQSSKVRLVVILGTMLTLTLVSILFELAWPTLLTKAGPTLPPREPTPSGPDKDDDDDKPIGAYIELQVQPAQAGLWTVVQWQDSAGGWQVVEGWQGTLDEGDRKRWWVAAKDFGQGPFRWVVTRGQNGPLLATSEAFSLPDQANEIVKVEVSLAP